jgi:hypothetical protein
LLSLGIATQAKANYTPTNTTWTQITSTDPTATATNHGRDDSAQPSLTETRAWGWTGTGQPQNKYTQLTFNTTMGAVSVTPYVDYADSAIARVHGGYNSQMYIGANDGFNFSLNQYVVYGLYEEGVDATSTQVILGRLLTGQQNIYDTAYVVAHNTAEVFQHPGGTATAGASTSKLIGFSLSP